MSKNDDLALVPGPHEKVYGVCPYRQSPLFMKRNGSKYFPESGAFGIVVLICLWIIITTLFWHREQSAMLAFFSIAGVLMSLFSLGFLRKALKFRELESFPVAQIEMDQMNPDLKVWAKCLSKKLPFKVKASDLQQFSKADLEAILLSLNPKFTPQWCFPDEMAFAFSVHSDELSEAHFKNANLNNGGPPVVGGCFEGCVFALSGGDTPQKQVRLHFPMSYCVTKLQEGKSPIIHSAVWRLGDRIQMAFAKGVEVSSLEEISTLTGISLAALIENEDHLLRNPHLNFSGDDDFEIELRNKELCAQESFDDALGQSLRKRVVDVDDEDITDDVSDGNSVIEEPKRLRA